MKRFLDQKRYGLDADERELLWHAVRRGATAPRPGPAATRRSFRPALGVTAVVAAAVLVAAWQEGSHRLPDAAAPAARPRLEVVELTGPAAPPPQAAPRTDRRADAAEAAVTAAPPATEAAAPPPPPVGLSGRVVDRETGERLANAVVVVAGTTYGVQTDSTGAFTLPWLPAGEHVDLEVQLLGYAPFALALDVPPDGRLATEVALESHIVETLQAFDVEGAEYMVEVKSAVTEHEVGAAKFEKYAIDAVEDALSRQAGVTMGRVGGLGHDRTHGGRSGEVIPMDAGSRTANGAPAPSAVPPAGAFGGSVTGGTRPPNGELYESMYFESAGVNPFVATEDDALSTFAVDVDDASWTLARNYLDRDLLPPPEAIRVEEFVNAFDPGWPDHDDAPFRIHLEGGASRFGSGYRLLRVGLAGRTIPDEDRKPANLVFVIDISGSMARENRLGAVKHALRGLLAGLREGDRVGLVVYGSRGEVRLPLTGIEHRDRILAAIEELRSGGSTNAAEGLELAYRMARGNYEPGNVNRLILCSDGVANNGVSTEAGGILDRVRRASDEGITLSTVGFGMGNYNDVLMERLADRGDGNYSYVDDADAADRVFRENLTGRLQTIAREAKVQVEFDPARVVRWRLLGYENRDLADEDFRNDRVDAGEVGAGHRVTALYEVKLAQPADPVRAAGGDSAAPDPASGRIGTVRLRWEAPAHDTAHAGEVTEIEAPITADLLAPAAQDGSPGMRTQALVAEFAEILRHSYWARENDLAALVPLADALAAERPGDAQLADLARLVRRAADIAAATRHEESHR